MTFCCVLCRNTTIRAEWRQPRHCGSFGPTARNKKTCGAPSVNSRALRGQSVGSKERETTCVRFYRHHHSLNAASSCTFLPPLLDLSFSSLVSFLLSSPLSLLCPSFPSQLLLIGLQSFCLAKIMSQWRSGSITTGVLWSQTPSQTLLITVMMKGIPHLHHTGENSELMIQVTLTDFFFSFPPYLLFLRSSFNSSSQSSFQYSSTDESPTHSRSYSHAHRTPHRPTSYPTSASTGRVRRY